MNTSIATVSVGGEIAQRIAAVAAVAAVAKFPVSESEPAVSPRSRLTRLWCRKCNFLTLRCWKKGRNGLICHDCGAGPSISDV